MRTIASLVFASISLALLTACMSPPIGLDVSQDRTSNQHKYLVAAHPLVAQAPVNRMHSWEIQLRTPAGEPVSGAHISIGGGMPQHGHGFPTQPKVTRELGDGRYLVEGMKFSMPGWWQVKLNIGGSAGVDEVTFNTVVASRSELVAKQ